MVERQRRERLERLLSQEIRRVTEDLERRKPLLVVVWGKQRVRAPFLDTTFSRWQTLGFDALMVLEAEQVAALEAFYRELDEVRLYLSFTEDMPRALDNALTSSISRLRRRADRALTSMGAPIIGDVVVLDWHMAPAPQSVPSELDGGEADVLPWGTAHEE